MLQVQIYKNNDHRMTNELLEYLKSELKTIEERVGYTFINKELLIQAFTHRSFVNENKKILKNHNERLEYLGDAVLGLLVTDFLYQTYPEKDEGELSDLKSRMIEAGSCYEYVQKLDVAEFLLMGVGERRNIGRGRITIIADLFEALMGAMYLETGYEFVKEYFFGHFKAEALRLIKKKHYNWKAEIQDYSQKKYKTPPTYKLIKEEGPDHLKVFYVEVYVGGEYLARGKGNSKREAEQEAAQEAVKKIQG